MAINRSNIKSLLIPGLNQIFGDTYGSVDAEHVPLFDIETSDRSFEEEVHLAGLGSAPTKQEGDSVKYDTAQETYKSRYINQTIALGFVITEEAVEDDLYAKAAAMRTKFLARSMANTKQVKAANIFNNAFNTDFPGGDGVPLISASHPVITGGTQSNLLTGQISETTLESAYINIIDQRDDRGILTGVLPQSIHISPVDQFTLFKVLKSDLSTSVTIQGTEGVTNVNDTNALRSGGYFPKGHYVNRRFTDSDAFFIRTDVPNGTKMFVRKAIAFGEDGDFDTGNMKYKARERYAFGWSDWRQWYGSVG